MSYPARCSVLRENNAPSTHSPSEVAEGVPKVAEGVPKVAEGVPKVANSQGGREGGCELSINGL